MCEEGIPEEVNHNDSLFFFSLNLYPAVFMVLFKLGCRLLYEKCK